MRSPAPPTLDNIAAELRLQVFRYLLPESLPFSIPATGAQPQWEPWRTCDDFRSLMLTSPRLNMEASELFFKHAEIEIDVNDKDWQCRSRRKNRGEHGLAIFGYSWSPNPLAFHHARRALRSLEDAARKTLCTFLSPVRLVRLQLHNYALIEWSIENHESNKLMEENMIWLVSVLNGCSSLEQITLCVALRSSRLVKPSASIRLPSLKVFLYSHYTSKDIKFKQRNLFKFIEILESGERAKLDKEGWFDTVEGMEAQ